MSEEYVTKCPIVPPYSNKVTIFGLLLQNFVLKFRAKLTNKNPNKKKNHGKKSKMVPMNTCPNHLIWTVFGRSFPEPLTRRNIPTSPVLTTKLNHLQHPKSLATLSAAALESKRCSVESPLQLPPMQAC